MPSDPDTYYALSEALKDKYLKRCGDCTKWMKSRECPRERNVGGMSRGPSWEEYQCAAFKPSMGTRVQALG
jgi:hypothetical protein